jgi:hypothetical protein
MVRHLASRSVAILFECLAWLYAFGTRRWADFLVHPTAVLTAVGLTGAAAILLIGVLLRIVAPRRALVISDFAVPKDSIPGLHVTGRSVGALLADEMLKIVKGAMGAKWNWESEFVGVKEFRSPLTLTTVATPVLDIDVKNVSWGRVRLAWNLIRQSQEMLSGDLIADSERIVLVARVPGQWSWRTDSFQPNQASLRAAVGTLAGAILRDIHPFIGGLWELSQGRTDDGITLLKNHLARQPDHVRTAEQLVKPLCDQGRSREALENLRLMKIPWYRRRDRGILQKSFSAYYLQQSPVDLNTAIWHARRAARLAPREPLFQRNLALLSAIFGREEEARRACRRALKLAPRYPYLSGFSQMVEERLAKSREESPRGKTEEAE